ncbi:cytochrome P450 71D11-like [Lotus japonicus]|uniref:cytochrome P450 71D11-like n=1 Tax=Lotus japonicus TaxID=34305 RepID=UPI002588E3DD|nr:cytochrome P450 71D11-like [Lotus japonicus]
MASQIQEVLALLTLFLSMLVTLVMIRKNFEKTHTTTNALPGPWKLPIIGNIHHLITSTPHRKLRDLAITHGPIMHLQLGEIFTIVVSSAEYAREVMKTHDIIFASRPRLLARDIMSYDCTDLAFSPYGDYWRQLRKISAMELLSTKRVRSLWPIREKEISTLIKLIASKEGSEINLTQEVVSTIYTFFSKAAFGKKYADQEEFILVIKELVKLSVGFYIGDYFPSAKWLQNLSGMRPKLEKLRHQLDKILENIINDHKEARSRAKEALVEAKGDLIDAILKFQETDSSDSNLDFHLTTNNIKAIILDFFSAGSGTAITTIIWAMTQMMRHPNVLKKTQVEVREVFDKRGKIDESGIEELKYFKAVIKEVLRLHPPAPLLLPRECKEACEVNGFNIPDKSRVIVNAWAIARDPKYWPEPDRFYPERFIDSSIDFIGTNFEYIPFGAGRRICPGMNYGMANVEQGLAFLLYHFDWGLPNGMKKEDLNLTEEFGVTMSRKDDLYLIPTVARPLPAT